MTENKGNKIKITVGFSRINNNMILKKSGSGIVLLESGTAMSNNEDNNGEIGFFGGGGYGIAISNNSFFSASFNNVRNNLLSGIKSNQGGSFTRNTITGNNTSQLGDNTNLVLNVGISKDNIIIPSDSIIKTGAAIIID